MTEKPEKKDGNDEMTPSGSPRAAVRLGFMEGDIDVPEDFDRMDEVVTNKMFRMVE